MWNTLQSKSTAGFLVIRNDKIVYEKYVSLNRHQTHYTASLVKGVVGGMSLFVAMNDGLISPDNLVRQFVPQWTADPIKSTIKVRELATHSSGLEDAEEGGLPHDQLTGWKGDFWQRWPPPNDPFTISRDAAPVLSAPGTVLSYSNPGFAMLSYVVTAALRGTPNQDLRSLLSNRIMNPIGVPGTEWVCGYDETLTVDGLPLVASWGGGDYSPDATARVARLLLRQGDWEGSQLLSPSVVRAVTTSPLPGIPGYGLFGWWGNVDNFGNQISPSLPRDAFYALGAGHQVVLVSPSLNLIMVRYGESIDGAAFSISPTSNFALALENTLFAPLMSTVIYPTVATTAATLVTATGAMVNGGVNPNGQSTTAWFEWGTSAALATFSSTTNQALGSGTTSVPVTAALSGLTSGTTYYFRVAASNAAGTTKGSILTFNTTAVAPTVTTNAASSITISGAMVNGGVNPNGQSTTAWFEWGTSAALATFSSTTNQALGSGTTSVPVTAALSGLTAGTTYYFRVAASNSGGTTKGAIASFSTTAITPTAVTNSATSITISGATVNGGVNPNGQSTTAWFEWGTSAALATFSSTTNQALGSGTTSVPVTAALSGLTAGTTYYFRVAASNAAGTTKGSILSFTTSAPLLAPTATTTAATSITANSARVNGGVNPNGQATTAWFEWGTSPTLATFSFHLQSVPGLRDDERIGQRGAVGADLRDDVLLPGSGFQLRRDREGIDP